MFNTLSYLRGSSVAIDANDTALKFAVNQQRPEVALRGVVSEPLIFRQLLLAFQSSMQPNMRNSESMSEQDWQAVPDPLVTIHRDQALFETLSTDATSYTQLSVPLSAMSHIDVLSPGTTNIDFPWDVRESIARLRSAVPITLSIGSGDIDSTGDRFERSLTIADRWLRGYLQMQSALTNRPYTFDVHPVDLLTAITYLREHIPPGPPRGLRYEFEPNKPYSLVLEPWDERITFRGTNYYGYRRTVRLWGRRRLNLLASVLPFADRVTVALFGRGLPHAYICHCGPYQFMLALAGWTTNDPQSSGLDLLAPDVANDPTRVAQVLAYLDEHQFATREEIATNLGLTHGAVEQDLFALCRGGRVLFDLTTGHFRRRELFVTPVDVAAIFVPDPRTDKARKLLDGNQVTLGRSNPGRAGRSETWVSAVVRDDANEYHVSIAVDDSGRLRFGRCECPFFQSFIMTRGPCEHILATRFALDTPASDEIAENPSAIAADNAAKRKDAAYGAIDEDETDDDLDDEDDEGDDEDSDDDESVEIPF